MARFPQAKISFDSTSITYYPDALDGFAVRLIVWEDGDRERYHVYYAGSRQEEESRERSILTFGFGLTNWCHVWEFSRGGEAYRWITHLNGPVIGWRPYWETCQFSSGFWRFWQRRKIQCLQNRLIDLDSGPPSACSVAR
jgi:hypothetical protein